MRSSYFYRFGEVTERPKVRHWKCRVRVKLHRGFESLPLRLKHYEPVVYVASFAARNWLFFGSSSLA
jgi:hypothetical protein